MAEMTLVMIAGRDPLVLEGSASHLTVWQCLGAINRWRADKTAISSSSSSMAGRSKWIARFTSGLETCFKTIPSKAASKERENVIVWAREYVKVKVRTVECADENDNQSR